MIIHQVNTKTWNLAGEPSGCEMLERSGRVVDQFAHVWRALNFPTQLPGLKILISCVRMWTELFQNHHTLLDRIPLLQRCVCTFCIVHLRGTIIW